MHMNNLITILDYGMGNLGSVQNMLKFLDIKSVITSDLAEIGKAHKLIIAGVGAFDSGMTNLKNMNALELLNKKALEEKTPILGICLGMQIFSKKSEEGTLPGLGWVKADTVKFKFPEGEAKNKIPHIGWNTVVPQRDDPLFFNFPAEIRFYFVHSYHLVCENQQDILGSTSHGYHFPSVIRQGNILGTQFHPEKSHKYGMQLLKNFCERV